MGRGLQDRTADNEEPYFMYICLFTGAINKKFKKVSKLNEKEGVRSISILTIIRRCSK
jgi:hypothetical protein